MPTVGRNYYRPDLRKASKQCNILGQLMVIVLFSNATILS
jgi:hypothetical protein